MAVTSDEILFLAQGQLDSAKCEAGYRNLVGRAYYAVYHKATEFHEALPAPGKSPVRPTGSHKTLTEKLRSPTVDDRSLAERSRLIGRLCRDLHFKRCKADYELGETFAHIDADQALIQAHQIFQLISDNR